MGDVYAIYGSGGYAREVMPLLKEYLAQRSQTTNNETYFIDDSAEQNSTVNDCNVYTFKDFVTKFSGEKINCCIAIADRKVRERLTNKCLENEIRMISLKSVTCVVMDAVNIGEGSVLSPFVTITSNVSIGKSFHANICIM